LESINITGIGKKFVGGRRIILKCRKNLVQNVQLLKKEQFVSSYASASRVVFFVLKFTE